MLANHLPSQAVADVDATGSLELADADRFFLAELALLLPVVSRCRFLGFVLVDETSLGGFVTLMMVGTAVGCSRFLKSLRNIVGSKCSEHTRQFLFRYSGVFVVKSSRRMLIAHRFAL